MARCRVDGPVNGSGTCCVGPDETAYVQGPAHSSLSRLPALARRPVSQRTAGRLLCLGQTAMGCYPAAPDDACVRYLAARNRREAVTGGRALRPVSYRHASQRTLVMSGAHLSSSAVIHNANGSCDWPAKSRR